MNEHNSRRLFAAAGIATVLLELGGVIVGGLGGRSYPTITSTPAFIAHALARPAGTAVWIGAYMELLSFGCFLAFAIWACARLGGGVLGAIATAAATGYATLSIASLGVLDAIQYRSGHGMHVEVGTALITVNEALYVGTWFLYAFFLFAAGPLAISSGRRALGWAGVGVASLTLALIPVSIDNLAQMSFMLWLAWIVWASIALARGERAPSRAFVAQHA